MGKRVKVKKKQGYCASDVGNTVFSGNTFMFKFFTMDLYCFTNKNVLCRTVTSLCNNKDGDIAIGY
jgi:hypothetical protein